VLQMKSAVNQDEIAASQPKGSPEHKVEASSRDIPIMDGAHKSTAVVENDRLFTVPLRSEPRLPVSANLLRSINSEVANLRSLQANSLAVVLKPDSRTEIFLKLELQGNKIEASARCERGDFQHLSSHWPELQRALEQQGVQLRDLSERATTAPTGAESGFSGFAQGEAERHAWREKEEPALRSFSEEPPKSVPTTQPKAVKRSSRLFESWA